MRHKKVIRAQKDHFHFTNYCFFCKKHINDKEIIPVWIDIPSGLKASEGESYFEPHYCCEACYLKEGIK